MKKMIFVEDDPGILEVARFIFERGGCDITLYTSAERLLSQPDLQPDIFILDKQLPDMDGLELCRKLKALTATQSIPVLMLSANPNIKALAAAAGANAVMEKPFEITELLSVVAGLTS